MTNIYSAPALRTTSQRWRAVTPALVASTLSLALLGACQQLDLSLDTTTSGGEQTTQQKLGAKSGAKLGDQFIKTVKGVGYKFEA